ncbi:MAG TPA: sialate O-acetylesterase [Candidatus Limnocylindria bacterium]|nr:sialate O-acetylesterase [Candidatus Limnocylindria bacterium]
MTFTRLFGFLAGVLLGAGCATRTATQQNEALLLTAPAHRLVYQRGVDGTGSLPIAGVCAWSGAVVEARVIEVKSGREVQIWQHVAEVRADGQFAGQLKIKGGWYHIEVRANHRRQYATVAVDRVGMGEVFIVVGHSVAHGGRTNLNDATSDLVNAIAWPTNSDAQRKEYERTADPQLLPGLIGTHFADDVRPAPFGNGTYFWAQFADRVAAAEGVPVLLLNAAFGGTSLEHWAKSARGEQFEHSFVKSPLRMPYINLHHALRRYATVTGVRAILADQGQNDWPENDAGKVFTNYVTWVKQARADLTFPALAVVVNRASPPGNRPIIRRVQEQMIREVPHCYSGPDYDTLRKRDRYDGVHFSASGLLHAAQLWADALTPRFFQQVTPYQPAR